MNAHTGKRLVVAAYCLLIGATFVVSERGGPDQDKPECSRWSTILRVCKHASGVYKLRPHASDHRFCTKGTWGRMYRLGQCLQREAARCPEVKAAAAHTLSRALYPLIRPCVEDERVAFDICNHYIEYQECARRRAVKCTGSRNLGLLQTLSASVDNQYLARCSADDLTEDGAGASRRAKSLWAASAAASHTSAFTLVYAASLFLVVFVLTR